MHFCIPLHSSAEYIILNVIVLRHCLSHFLKLINAKKIIIAILSLRDPAGIVNEEVISVVYFLPLILNNAFAILSIFI